MPKFSAQQLSDGGFQPHGVYCNQFHGNADLAEIIGAFTTIEAQSRWNPDVIGGEWLSERPEIEGAIRHMKLTRGMWMRQQLTQVQPHQIRYVILEGGGGLPLQQARIQVTLESPPDVPERVRVLNFEMRYLLTRSFRLMKPVIERAIRSNLDKNLPRLLAPGVP